jgi:hypothetical protein
VLFLTVFPLVLLIGVQWASLPNGPSEVSSVGLCLLSVVLFLLPAAAAAAVLLSDMMIAHLGF